MTMAKASPEMIEQVRPVFLAFYKFFTLYLEFYSWDEFYFSREIIESWDCSSPLGEPYLNMEYVYLTMQVNLMVMAKTTPEMIEQFELVRPVFLAFHKFFTLYLEFHSWYEGGPI